MPASSPDELPKLGSTGGWFWKDGTEVTEQEMAKIREQYPDFGGGTTGNLGEDVTQQVGGPLGLVPQVITPDAPGAELDTVAADEQRSRMQRFADSLQQQAATGEGAWRQRFQDAVRQSMQSAQALGQSDPSSGYQSSLRNIGNAQSGIQQRAVGEGEMLRNQAMLDARGQLGDILGSQAGMDIEQAGYQAGVRRQRRAAQQALIDQANSNQDDLAGGIGQALMSDGGRVPGKPNVFGDDERNDTVPAWLSPGEIVVPRTKSRDPDKAAAFARAVALRGAKGYADGGSTGIRPATVDEGGGLGARLLNLFLPHIGQKATADALNKNLGTGVQPATVEYGGALDVGATGSPDTQYGYAATAAQQDALAALFAGQAAGTGPSVSPYMQQKALDNNMEQALAARQQQGAPQATVLQAIGKAGVGDASDVARQTAREQSHGQKAYAQAVQQRRAQEMALAQAQQQAGWENTMMNAGLTLENQARLRNALSGAGQAAAGLAGSRSQGYEADPDSLTALSDNPYPQEKIKDPEDEWDLPEQFAFGGVAAGRRGGKGDMPRAYADGGEVEDELQLQSYGQSVKLRDSEPRQRMPETRAERKAAEWDEEAGYSPGHKKPKKPTEKETAFARAVRQLGEFGRRAGASLGSVRKYAEGGGVSDAGMDPRVAFPFVDPAPPPSVGQPQPLGFWGQYSPMALIESARRASIEKQAQEGAAASRASAPPSAAPRSPAESLASMQAAAPGMTGGPPPDTSVAAQSALKSTPGLKTKEQWEAEQASRTQPAPAAEKPKAVGGGMRREDPSVLGDALAAGRAQERADLAVAAANVEGAKARADAIETAMTERRRVEERGRQAMEDARARFDAAQTEMQRIDTSVDPGRFWATRSTGDKVLGIIGLIFGALGANKDGINRAAVILNQAIDRDLEAQKAQHMLRLQKGKASADAAQTYYAMAHGAVQDELAAQDLARAAALDSVAAKTEQMVAATGDQQAKAKGMMFATAQRQAAQARRDAAWEKAADRAIELAKIEASSGRGDKAANKELRDAASAHQTMGQTVDELEGLIKETNVVSEKVGSRAARMETLAADLLLQVKQAEKLGALDKGAVEIADKLIGDPTATFTLDSTKISKLRALLNQSKRRVQSTAAVTP